MVKITPREAKVLLAWFKADKGVYPIYMTGAEVMATGVYTQKFNVPKPLNSLAKKNILVREQFKKKNFKRKEYKFRLRRSPNAYVNLSEVFLSGNKKVQDWFLKSPYFRRVLRYFDKKMNKILYIDESAFDRWRVCSKEVAFMGNQYLRFFTETPSLALEILRKPPSELRKYLPFFLMVKLLNGKPNREEIEKGKVLPYATRGRYLNSRWRNLLDLI